MINIYLIDIDIDNLKLSEKYIESHNDFKLCGAYTTTELFHHDVAKIHINTILIFSLSLVDRLDDIYWIKQKFPSLKILIFAETDQIEIITKSFKVGAEAVIHKQDGLDCLYACCLTLLKGSTFMSDKIIKSVTDSFLPPKVFIRKLSSRELQIVEAIKDGLSYKLVAAKYFISIDTVRQHIKNIYSKLEINSKAELINIYYKDLL
jgi:DNA-binding NarL/FixJ family response regulator